MNKAIENAAQNALDWLGENTEDLLEETYAATWPGGEDDWFDEAGSPEAMRHSDRIFAAMCRALIPLLEFAASAADKRAEEDPS